MSRTEGRRSGRHLASTVEDAAVLFSSLLASPALPAAVVVVTASSMAATEAAAATATAALDWLSGLFRLGLACEKSGLGDTEVALAAAPEASLTALADFLAGPPPPPPPLPSSPGLRRATGARWRGGTALKSMCRASASARWLGCRLAACLRDERGGGGGGGAGECRQWHALRRDCALQV